MLPALQDRERVAIWKAACVLAFIVLCLAPFDSQSSVRVKDTRGEEAVQQRIAFPKDDVVAMLPAIRRDPFVASAHAIAEERSTLFDTFIVQAVELGPEPGALVDTGHGSALVHVGESIAGSPIVAIDSGGVALSNGVRLLLHPGPR